jgi:hypothetical protein
LLQKYDYLLWKASNRNETPLFCDTLTNIKIDIIWSKSVCVKTTGL